VAHPYNPSYSGSGKRGKVLKTLPQ
jgi:hypothetical protein